MKDCKRCGTRRPSLVGPTGNASAVKKYTQSISMQMGNRGAETMLAKLNNRSFFEQQKFL